MSLHDEKAAALAEVLAAMLDHTLDHTLDELLLAHLKTVPALAVLHGYTGQDNADHKLPALTIGTTSAPTRRFAARSASSSRARRMTRPRRRMASGSSVCETFL